MIGSRTRMAQYFGMPLGNPTYMYSYFMTANSRGLPLTGTRLTSLGPEWGGLGRFAPCGPNDDRVQNTHGPVIWDATWQSNIYLWALHDCQLAWPAFDWNPVDQPRPGVGRFRPPHGVHVLSVALRWRSDWPLGSQTHI